MGSFCPKKGLIYHYSLRKFDRDTITKDLLNKITY